MNIIVAYVSKVIYVNMGLYGFIKWAYIGGILLYFKLMFLFVFMFVADNKNK